jgi:hypothetical protein
MKSAMTMQIKTFFNLQLPARMLFAVIMAAAWTAVTAQDQARIQARFADPVYSPASRTYSVDIQLQILDKAETFFGMNLRFYYDATMLEYAGIDQFPPGQGFRRHAAKAFVGNDQSGVQLLGLSRAAGYVNGSVEEIDERYPLVLQPLVWKKLCRVNFKVPEAWSDETSFCPSLVWDLEPFKDGGSLLPGSDGLMISVKEQDRSTRTESVVTGIEGLPFNWRYRRQEGLPFGNPYDDVCISLAQTTSTDPDLTSDGDYVLFQNHPNPFDEQTTIEFILPFAQEAKLHMYTLQGELLEEIKGYYPAGRSKVVLLRKPWMDRVGMVYYQLVAADNVTLVRKMNMVSR